MYITRNFPFSKSFSQTNRQRVIILCIHAVNEMKVCSSHPILIHSFYMFGYGLFVLKTYNVIGLRMVHPDLNKNTGTH